MLEHPCWDLSLDPAAGASIPRGCLGTGQRTGSTGREDPASSQQERYDEAITFPSVEGLQKLRCAQQGWQQSGLGDDPKGNVLPEPSPTVTKGQRNAGIPRVWRGCKSIGGQTLTSGCGLVRSLGQTQVGKERGFTASRQENHTPAHVCPRGWINGPHHGRNIGQTTRSPRSPGAASTSGKSQLLGSRGTCLISLISHFP